MKNVTIRKCVLACVVALLATPIVAEGNESTERPVAGLVRGIKVLPDKAPDCSSLKSIVESVTRDCKSNDEKAIAIYNFMRLLQHRDAARLAGIGAVIVCHRKEIER